MLTQLFIQNIALISKADIEFGKGFNVFTGETGAGKSILVGAVNAVLGGRTTKDIIRAGENKASISAVFSNISPDTRTFIKECGFEIKSDDQLLLSRDITASSNICKINGKPATVALLKQIGERLVHIHGQHDNQLLFSPENHRKIIDAFANLGDTFHVYKQQYLLYKQVCAQIDALTVNEQLKAHKFDLLTYQIKEIQDAALEIGEEEELSARRTVIKNAAKLAENLDGIVQLLNGDPEGALKGAVELIDTCTDHLIHAARYMNKFEPMVQVLQSFKYELDEITSTAKDSLDELEYDSKQLEEIEIRLDTIHRLKKKYGTNIEEILSFCESAQSQLDDLIFSDQKLEKYAQEKEKLYSFCVTKAEELTTLRTQCAAQLSFKIEQELNDLDMESVTLSISIKPKALSSNGADEIEFFISTNKGEDEKPLSKIASGGELSRIMLAIKTVTCGKDDIDTLMFDEVDSGVSGRAAQKIGLKLKQLGQYHQVVAVTHLSQVAIYGEHHLLISKNIIADRTYTDIQTLSFEDKVLEIARINSGENITELSKHTARELLLLSQEKA